MIARGSGTREICNVKVNVMLMVLGCLSTGLLVPEGEKGNAIDVVIALLVGRIEVEGRDRGRGWVNILCGRNDDLES